MRERVAVDDQRMLPPDVLERRNDVTDFDMPNYLDVENIDRVLRHHQVGDGQLAVLAMRFVQEVDRFLADDVARGDKSHDSARNVDDEQKTHAARDHGAIGLRDRRIRPDRGGGHLAEVGHHFDRRRIETCRLRPGGRRLYDHPCPHARHR